MSPSYVGNANQVYDHLVKEVMNFGSPVNPRGTKTREIHPAMIELTNPRQRLVTSYGRPINVTFAVAEVLWILSARRDVEMLSFYNGTIEQFSDNGVEFNAPYGWRLRVHHGHDQIADLVATLKADPDTRQGVLQIWDSQMDLPWVNNQPNATKDRACNVLAHVMIRDRALDWLQIVRSNDLIWGTPYNWMQFTHLQEYVAQLVGVPVGRYIHVADSLHIYDYHYSDAEAIRAFDIYEHLPVHPSFVPHDLHHLQNMEKVIRLYEATTIQAHWYKLPECWQAALSLFLAHAFYKQDENLITLNALRSCVDRVYGAAQARFYWSMRWHKAKNRSLIKKHIYSEWPEAVASWITDKETDNGQED